MPNEICKPLPWDSEFFGLRIARFQDDRLSPESATQVLDYCAQESIDCVYLLLADEPATLDAARAAGFEHVDTRLTFARALDQEPAPATRHPVRPARPADLPVLREIARDSHTDSRFYSDPHFDRARSNALYETWIERSAQGWANQTFVVDDDAGQAAGYITCHVAEDGTGSIGLFSVSDRARGRGLGGSLIAAALAFFQAAGIRRVQVVTQERNRAARHAYERYGFVIQSRALWFHGWPKLQAKAAPAYRIPFNQPGIFGHEYAYMADAVARGHISGDGAYTRKCQALLESELGVPRVLLTTSCTHALEMAALLLEIQPGDEVIVPSFTFVSTVNAFVLRGARPVFADIRPDTLNIDELRLESLLTPRTRAIVVVHYAGVGCAMDAILGIARRRGIPVVEDNAHGLFARYKGRQLGTFGCLATQSFHETKNIHCGEGGALVINDPALIRRAEILREKGTNRSAFFRGEVDKYTWVDIGSSYVMSDSLAAFLYAQLEARERIQRARRRVWVQYAAELSDWAEENGVGLPYVPTDCEQSYHMFYLRLPSCEARQQLIEHLKRRGILSVFHYVPLHSSPMGLRFGAHPGDYPVTERVSDTLLRLPFYGGLTQDLQDEVIRAIQEFRVAARTDIPAPLDQHIPVENASDLVPAGLTSLAQACEDRAGNRSPSPVHS